MISGAAQSVLKGTWVFLICFMHFIQLSLTLSLVSVFTKHYNYF